MANFDTCFQWMLANEDYTPPRYQVVPDKGGFAISGINSGAYPTEANAIAAMNPVDRGPAVQAFYEANFWNQWYEKLMDDELAKRVFDAAVNMGPNTAVKILQKASGCPVDGHWGPQTVNTANSLQNGLVDAFKAQRLQHYKDIVAGNPADEVYLGTENRPGPWWRRAVK